MGKKENVKDVMLLHSQAKVKFYAEYLKRYLRILCLSDKVDTINIFDVFCGMGIYKDGNKGSSVVAYDEICNCLNDPMFQNRGTKISLWLNDIDTSKIDIVRQYVSEHKNQSCTVNFCNKDINQMFSIVKDEISVFSPHTRNLIFIDPYGYKDIKGGLLYDLLNDKSEVILFLPISFMYRFSKSALEDDDNKYQALKNFTDSLLNKFQKEQILQTQSVEDYIEIIKDGLKFGNEVKTTSYVIERDKVNSFALFFMTRHIYGLEKILEVKWQLDEKNGKGFRLPQANNLFSDFFNQQDTVSAQKDIFEQLKDVIINALSEPRDNRALYSIVLEHEFLPKQANEVLRYLQNNDKRFVVTKYGTDIPARKNSFYLGWKHFKLQPMVEFKYINQ